MIMNLKLLIVLCGMLLLPSFVSANLNFDLYQVAGSDNVERAAQLINQGALINCESYCGSDYVNRATPLKTETPLYNAVKSNSKDMVRFLVNQGADINMPIVGGGYGSQQLDDYYGPMLLNHGNGLRPLHVSLSIKYPIEMIQLLIDLGVDVDGKDRSGRTLLHYVNSFSSYQNILDIIKLLVNAGANINCRDNRGFTPLHANESVKNIMLLVNLGANINSKNIKGQTPLHIAVQAKDNEVVIKLLIDSRANVNSADNEGRTPLHLVANINHYAIGAVDAISLAQLLIKSGANINAKDVNGNTPYKYAQTEEMRNLLNR